MSLLGCYLLPHPPIIIPEVGKGEEEKIIRTSQSFHTLGREIAEKSPDTIIIITPHGNMFEDAIALSGEKVLSGDMKNFGAPQVSMKFQINNVLTAKINKIASDEGISTIMTNKALLKKNNISFSLDHGAMVPLYFINKYFSNYKLVHITYAALNDIELYKFGIAINKAVEELKVKAVLIASGDLSHKLKNEGPYGYSPYGERFDREFLQHLQNGDTQAVLGMDRQMICNAGECGRRSVGILLGALEGRRFRGELLSYEGTFGVGYGVMRFNFQDGGAPLLDKLAERRIRLYEKRISSSDLYVKLARESLTKFLETGEMLDEMPEYVTEEMKKTRRGVFVSLKKDGDLRGCIGSVFPTTDSIAEEIVRNAVEAGLNDPRFNEVERKELIDISFSVDVLTEPEPACKEELNPKIYGVIVKTKTKTGLLLPDLEGVDSVDEQLSIATRKGGIRPGQEYNIFKFQVIRHKEIPEAD